MCSARPITPNSATLLCAYAEWTIIPNRADVTGVGPGHGVGFAGRLGIIRVAGRRLASSGSPIPGGGAGETAPFRAAAGTSGAFCGPLPGPPRGPGLSVRCGPASHDAAFPAVSL